MSRWDVNRKIYKAAWLLMLSLVLTGRWSAFAQEATAPSEYEVKAAFLYNFAKFVEWPAQAFPESDSPFTIGVVGKSPLSADLERVAKGKTVNGRPLNIKPLASASDVGHCQIIFIPAGNKKRADELLGDLTGKAILTVGEKESAGDSVGMIDFVMEGKKVRFQINDTATTQAGLKVSSKLLSLAKKREMAK